MKWQPLRKHRYLQLKQAKQSINMDIPFFQNDPVHRNLQTKYAIDLRYNITG